MYLLRHRVSRRRFLRGILGGTAVTVGLPIFGAHLNFNGTALADGSAFPSRFGLFFWGNGVVPYRWVPEGTGTDWIPSDQLEPIAHLRDHFSVVTGLEVKVPNIIPHNSGAGGILTGKPVVARGGEAYTFAGPSIDQVIAAEIGGDTRFRSIEFGAEPGGGRSYNGPDNRNPPESSPLALFDRLFGEGFREPGDTSEPDPRLALRRSVLDAVVEQANDFRRELGSEDQLRLDQHLQGVRDLEVRVARLQEDPPELAACMRPDQPLDAYPPIEGRPQIREKNRAMCDVIALAMACDQTRVFSNWIVEPVSNNLIGEAEAGHHQLTHDEPGDQPQVNEIVRTLVGEFGYLLESLRNIPEGDGTLLDHCAVLGTSDVSYGRNHSLDEFPIIVAGTANGRLRTGLHVRSEIRDTTNKVMLSLIRSMGILAADFGADDGFTEDGMTEIEV